MAKVHAALANYYANTEQIELIIEVEEQDTIEIEKQRYTKTGDTP